MLFAGDDGFFLFAALLALVDDVDVFFFLVALGGAVAAVEGSSSWITFFCFFFGMAVLFLSEPEPSAVLVLDVLESMMYSLGFECISLEPTLYTVFGVDYAVYIAPWTIIAHLWLRWLSLKLARNETRLSRKFVLFELVALDHPYHKKFGRRVMKMKSEESGKQE